MSFKDKNGKEYRIGDIIKKAGVRSNTKSKWIVESIEDTEIFVRSLSPKESSGLIYYSTSRHFEICDIKCPKRFIKELPV